MAHLSNTYCIVNMGKSTSALLFFDGDGASEVYIGNPSDIAFEAQALQNNGYNENELVLLHLRELGQLPRPNIPKGIKHYDVEECFQGEKLVSYTIRSVHESHGKLNPNSITFTVAPALLNDEVLYPKALRWITQRSRAFTTILESEGMHQNADFILSCYIYALENPQRLEKFTQADRGIQTVTQDMI